MKKKKWDEKLKSQEEKGKIKEKLGRCFKPAPADM